MNANRKANQRETHKVRIVFFGTPQFVLPILEVLRENFEVVGVVTGADQIQGRKKVLTPTAVKEWTQKNLPNAKIFTPEKFDEQTRNLINQLTPDLFVVAAYGKIIPQSVLDLPKFGALNVHPSLLPKFRGATPIQSAILAGVKSSGVTIIKMDDKMDHGPIVYQKEFGLSEQDTLESLHNLFFHHAAEVLAKLIPDFVKSKIKSIGQNHDQATFCKILKKEDGYFDIDSPPSSIQLDRMIRAYYPWPTAWTKWRVKEEDRVVKFYPEGMVQMEGKNKVSMKEFLNGYPDFPIKDL